MKFYLNINKSMVTPLNFLKILKMVSELGEGDILEIVTDDLGTFDTTLKLLRSQRVIVNVNEGLNNYNIIIKKEVKHG